MAKFRSLSIALIAMISGTISPTLQAFELPLFKAEAEERGYTLPEAIGLSFGYMNVSQGINVDSITLAGLGPLDDIGIKTKGGYQESQVITLKADVWVLPFLNFYAIGGKLDGYSETTISHVKLFPNLPGDGIEINEPFRLDLDGYTYGAGTVIAGGYESVFALAGVN